VRILLTGAFGNVGGHTLAELLRRGRRVRCFDRRTPANLRIATRFAVETVWGDITDADAVARATANVDTVVHLAALIPPASDEQPNQARVTNVDGTANVIAACQARQPLPRILFTSTFDVHGHTLDSPPPRHVDDPLVATNGYTQHKIECEAMVRASGLTWSILRLADVPVLGIRDPHPIMFEIGPDNRIEAVHADDAGFAIANVLDTPQAWDRVLFIGGGASCQLTYREYLTRVLAAMGVGPLPDEAFSTAVYATDWVDTVDSEALLHYQRHTFDDITRAIANSLGWKRRLVSAASPLARAAILRLSPYYRKESQDPTHR
jgi:nucleoside-diphosphate-sugar epimerase